MAIRYARLRSCGGKKPVVVDARVRNGQSFGRLEAGLSPGFGFLGLATGKTSVIPLGPTCTRDDR
jgi:hypothetical protein